LPGTRSRIESQGLDCRLKRHIYGNIVSSDIRNRESKLKKKTSGSAKPPSWEAGLKSKLDELRRLEKKAFRRRHGRTDFYEYLKGVYNLCDWTDPKVSQREGQRVAKICNLKVRAGTAPVRTVIDATSSSQDRQVKSRWARALQYAIRKNAPGSEFKNFLKRNGGPFGCASKMAALQKQKQTPWGRAWGTKARRASAPAR
jgi:hypothetical protein